MRFHKFKAQKTTVDGVQFASKKESKRYSILKLLERAGEISGLTLQPEFVLSVNDHLICKYIADFTYTEKGKVIVEDVKGFKTREYRLKKKLLRALLGIEIRET